MSAVRAYMWAMAGREGVILCGRQFMNSLDDSSMEEVKAAIRSEPWLAPHFDIGEKYIKTIDGRISYKFAGLDRNLDSIKSKARILLCWVDEAEPVTEEAWSKLIPTLREEDSELWVTWNPERKASPTHKRFRAVKDPRVKVAEINWRDNPWFPEILNRVRLKDQAERPDTYDHVWEGAFGSSYGAILSKWVSKAEREGRIHDDVLYDPAGAPVEVSGDLGFRDTASWWYWQRVPGGFNVLRYDAGNGMDAQDWIPRIRENLTEMGARLGKIWLPHDARAKTFQSKHTTMEQFLAEFKVAHVAVVPQSRKADQISAARTVIDRCAFSKTACEEGLDGLSAWEFEWNVDAEVFSREPVHNWASHPSDAFAYGCQVMQEHKPPPTDDAARYAARGTTDGRIVTATLDELWKTAPKASKRI